LKAAKYDPGIVAIEDVTREQVVQWIKGCIIPQEFEADFVVSVRAAKRSNNNPKGAN